jgi:hypothetical protein
MGRGLSDQQRRVLEYLQGKHDEGNEVVPEEWIMHEVIGLKATKDIFSQRSIDHGARQPWDSRAPDYGSKKACWSRTKKRLQARGLIEFDTGLLTYTKEIRFVVDKSTGERRQAAWRHEWLDPEAKTEHHRIRRGGWKLTVNTVPAP